MRRFSLLVGVASLLLACQPSSPPRVVLVGIDGADWQVIDGLIDRGRLPAFAEIRSGGATGVLETNYSSASPAIWNSIATGVLPERHGITDFVVRSERSYYELPVTRYQRRAPALWNVLAQHGRRVCVVAWWASWPAEEVPGCIVSQRFFLSSFGVGPIGGAAGIGVGGENPDYAEDTDAAGLTWPPELATRLRDELGDRSRGAADATELGRLLASLRAEGAGREAHSLDVLENILRTDLLVRDAALHLAAESGPFDLLALYLEGADVASHLFWKYAFPKPWARVPRELGGLPPDHARFEPILARYYDQIDAILAAILERLPEGDLLVLASDHGFMGVFDPFDYRYTANRLLAELGFLERDAASGAVAFARTSFFDHGSRPWEHERELRVNLAGRYPLGRVATEDVDARIAELGRALGGLATNTGKRVVLAIRPSEDGAAVSVAINPKLPRGESVTFGERTVPVSELFPPRRVSGDHRPEGVFAFYGAGVESEQIGPLSSLAIAPTVLAVLGLPAARDMDGEPFAPIVAALGGETGRVDSYALLEEPPEPAGGANDLDASLLERLRSLGYLE